MNEYSSMLLIAAVALGFYQLGRTQDRMKAIEAKLDALLRHLGVEWGKYAEPSDRVKALAKDPNSRVEAIKAYREQTGLGLKEAAEVIHRLSRPEA